MPLPAPDEKALDVLARKNGSICRVLPSQFHDLTFQELERLAHAGNDDAISARKLLTDGRLEK